MKKAKAIQICGTGSGVGKSVLVAGLCRIFLQDGYKVAPFKAQNMALNSFVTKERGEIGRAQVMQAEACGIEPGVDMNPVLIKPSSDTGAQVIVRGKPAGNMHARAYIKYKHRLRKVVHGSFDRLTEKYEIVVMEGAGSPAEINLKAHDIVNLKMAEYAKAPVILAGDIDNGGVFAWIVGTLELLNKKERAQVKGIIINKFRGDKALLKPAIDFLQKRAGIPVLGVVPYFKNIKLPQEDSVSLERTVKHQRRSTNHEVLNISIIHLPHISNFTDFDALEKEPDVKIDYINDPAALNGADIIILPGTKNTIADLLWLRKTGLADKILASIGSRLSAALIGICGGYQMLGKKIYDRHALESREKKTEGLGLLPMETYLRKSKILAQVKARDIASGCEVSGYEIHHGQSRHIAERPPIFKIYQRNAKKVNYCDGMQSEDARISGTYIHGLFDSDIFRRHWLNRIRKKKGWPQLESGFTIDNNHEFDKLAGLLRENIDIKALYKILNI